MRPGYEISVEFDTEDEVYTITAEVSPFVPGKSWGAPEDCWPDEGGEIESVKVRTASGLQLTEAEFEKRVGKARYEEMVAKLESELEG